MKFLKILSSNNISGAGVLALAIILANIINFLFNAFLGRVLSFEDYGVVNLLTSFTYLSLILVNGLYTTVNHRVAVLASSKQNHEGYFYHRVLVKCFIYSSLFALIWLILSPFISSFFKLPSIFPIAVFAPVIIFSLLAAVMKGYLQGKLFFIFVGIILIIEPLSKLLMAVIFVLTKNNALTYLAIPISAFITLAVAYIFIRLKPIYLKSADFDFPSKFFTAALVTGAAGTAFLTLDVILAKHFLSPTEAGKYALLSLVGKMIYFLGTIFNSLIVTLVSKQEAAHQSSKKLFLVFCGFTCLSSLSGFLILGPLGFLSVPILFGTKALSLIPYLPLYTFSIGLFTISSVFLSYHLVQHNYLFPLIAILFSLLLIGGILAFHSSILQIIQVIFTISCLNLLTMIVMHYKNLNFNLFGAKELV